MLIPSSHGALTHLNYHKRAAQQRAKVAQQKFQTGRHAAPDRDNQYTSLFTDEVSAGVVVWATWQMIQALPPDLRRQYEALRVETVVYYPKAFVADSWQELGALRDLLSTGAAFDWAQSLDLQARTRTTVDDLDEKYACLRYPVSNLAAKLVELRKRAKTSEPASSLDKALKLMANTLYGALCSPHLPTQNVVAAQVVTGTARALAFAMAQSLNAHNVITDGVIYRRDVRRLPPPPPELPRRAGRSRRPVPQPGPHPGHRRRVPAVLRQARHAVLRRVREGLSIPVRDARGGAQAAGGIGRGRVRRAVPGRGGELRETPHWQGGLGDRRLQGPSFRASDKERLGRWLLDVCSRDHYDGPPDAVESFQLLTWQDALAASVRALRNSDRAVVPLGMARPQV